MSATDDLIKDHLLIRRLPPIIDRCCSMLSSGKKVPTKDIDRIAEIIEEFVDRFHHHKEEHGYFPATHEKNDKFEDEIRKFMIEHEFARRIAKRIRIHLDDYAEDEENVEPLVRYLGTYSIFIKDHTSKEDQFFTRVEKGRHLSRDEENHIFEKFCKMKTGKKDIGSDIEYLEQASWMKP